MPYAITLRLDRESARHVEALWRALAKAGVSDHQLRLNYAPHVTLAVLDDLDVDGTAARLADLARASSPPALSFGALGLFPGEPSVLWLAPTPTRELHALHEAVHDLLPLDCHPHYRVGTWMPHCTLAPALDSRQVGDALAALDALWKPISGTATSMEIVFFEPATVLWSAKLSH